MLFSLKILISTQSTPQVKKNIKYALKMYPIHDMIESLVMCPVFLVGRLCRSIHFGTSHTPDRGGIDETPCSHYYLVKANDQCEHLNNLRCTSYS